MPTSVTFPFSSELMDTNGAARLCFILTADYADYTDFGCATMSFYWPDCHRWMTASGRFTQMMLRLMMEWNLVLMNSCELWSNG